MKARILTILICPAAALLLLVSLAAPLAALAPHEDPDALEPEYSGVAFLYYMLDYLDQAINRGTFEADAALGELSQANLPEDLAPTAVDLILSSEELVGLAAAQQTGLDRIVRSVRYAMFQETSQITAEVSVDLDSMDAQLQRVVGDISTIADQLGLLETDDATGELSRLTALLDQRASQIETLIERNRELVTAYSGEAEELAAKRLPQLTLSVLPQTAFVGDYIGFEGYLTLDGKPLVGQRISLEVDRINLATTFTNSEGYYRATAQLPERYFDTVTLQTVYIAPETAVSDHLPALSPEVPVALRYYPADVFLDLPAAAYPDRDVRLYLQLDYAGASPPPARPCEVYLEDELVLATTLSGTAAYLDFPLDAETTVGSQLLTLELPAAGRYAPAERMALLTVARAPLTLTLERPTLALLPGTVRYRGRVASELGPAAGAEVTLGLGNREVTVVTNQDGVFGAELEIGIAGGLVGRQPVTVQVIPAQPWHQRLSETRNQVVVNLVNCILLGCLLLVVLAYALSRLDFRLRQPQRMTVRPEAATLPEVAPEIKSPPLPRTPPEALPQRVVYWYYRAVAAIERLTGLVPAAGQTLREFAQTASRKLGPLAPSFLDLTRLVERLAYSPYRASAADVSLGESLAGQLDRQDASVGGQDADA